VLVLAAGRWLLRPLFLLIASVRSAELFSLAVLLAVLASAWATHRVGLSLALGAFLAGMMLAETEFRHQVEATIRSYKEVLLGLFFITVGMLLDVRLLFRDIGLVTAILIGMLVLKTAVVTLVAEPATKSWFKSLRTGVVVAQGGEFGFALLTLSLRRELLAMSWERFSVAQFKDRFGLTRKWAIPLLEHLDASGVTRRAGDDRLVARTPAVHLPVDLQEGV